VGKKDHSEVPGTDWQKEVDRWFAVQPSPGEGRQDVGYLKRIKGPTSMRKQTVRGLFEYDSKEGRGVSASGRPIKKGKGKNIRTLVGSRLREERGQGR